MARFRRFGLFNYLQGRLTDFVVRQLTKPLHSYTVTIPNDLTRLKRHIRKGDVVLVEGNERISECIKYLTQSSWSHSALYVGDEPLRRDPATKQELTEKFGEEAEYLLVEALVESGVTVSPLSKYRDFNIRVCRPYGISSSDLREVIDEALRDVGESYDVKNVFDLARYFLPVSLVPPRLRRKALHFGSGDPTRVICSSLIAECFQKVKFPIVPRFEPLPDAVPEQSGKLRSLLAFRRRAPFGAMRMLPPTLVTPRDFDLSPYFEIVKFNVVENWGFDYRRILWVEDAPPEAKAEKSA
jgi:Permuted papain-like amidase enzyme, YaeF/YiiX, C92 family